jgi:hypothetical protein
MSIEGFVPLSSYDDRRDDSGHSAAWKALREAIKAGEVEGYQRGGSNRWIVHKEQADRYLARTLRERRPAPEPEVEHGTAILASIAGVLGEILETLREINSSIPPRGDDQ